MLRGFGHASIPNYAPRIQGTAFSRWGVVNSMYVGDILLLIMSIPLVRRAPRRRKEGETAGSQPADSA